MNKLTVPWFRSFQRRFNLDGSFDSICVGCCSTVAHCRQYTDLDRLEYDHVCEERVFSLDRKPPATETKVAPFGLRTVA